MSVELKHGRMHAASTDAPVDARPQPDHMLPAPLLDDDAGDIVPLGPRRREPPRPALAVPSRPGRNRQRAARTPRVLVAGAAATIIVLACAAVALKPVFVVSVPAPTTPAPQAPRAISGEIVVNESQQAADAARAARAARAVSAQRRHARERAAARRVAARKRAGAQRRLAARRRAAAGRRAAVARRRAPAHRATTPAIGPGASARPRVAPPPAVAPEFSRPARDPTCREFPPC